MHYYSQTILKKTLRLCSCKSCYSKLNTNQSTNMADVNVNKDKTSTDSSDSTTSKRKNPYIPDDMPSPTHPTNKTNNSYLLSWWYNYNDRRFQSWQNIRQKSIDLSQVTVKGVGPLRVEFGPIFKTYVFIIFC